MKKFWVVSAAISYGNDTGSQDRRQVVDVHPVEWAARQEEKYRCTVRLLHWEAITAKESVRLRKATLE